MSGQMTRDEATARFADSEMCAAQSKLYRRGNPKAFFICTADAGHEKSAHTACDGEGYVVARWKSETSLIEVWIPDGYHIV